jgi:hypothetical protein
MKTNTTLYLHADEAKAFAALPDALREGWTVEPETGTAYEDADVLRVRAGMARFDGHPELKRMAAQVLAGERLSDAQLKGIPEAILPELYFSIGASGIRILMKTLFPTIATDEDVAGFAGFSQLRHDILATNASISYA